MNIQSATQVAAKQQTVSSAKAVEKQKNFMLKLLAVQMEKQSPLKPMDSSKVGQQLAAFASVEQQQMTNSLLKTLISSVQKNSQAQPKSYVGRTATVRSDTAALDIHGFGKWSYTPPAGSKSAIVKITDEKGKELFQKTISNLKAGENHINWKGPLDSAGLPSKGKFKLSVDAVSAQGVATKVKDINSIGKITKMIVDDKGGVQFQINNQLFAKSAIKSLSK